MSRCEQSTEFWTLWACTKFCCIEILAFFHAWSFHICRKGVVMCRDSVETEWVYVVKSGSCRVLKSLHEAKPDLQGLEHQEYSADVKAVKGEDTNNPRLFFHSDFRLSFPNLLNEFCSSCLHINRIDCPRQKTKRNNWTEEGYISAFAWSNADSPLVISCGWLCVEKSESLWLSNQYHHPIFSVYG